MRRRNFVAGSVALLGAGAIGCTDAGQKPRNLKHFVVDNQCYQTVETMPIVNQGGSDYTAMARAAGIDQAITIDNLVDLDRMLPGIVVAPGPYFVRLRVEAEPDYQRAPPANYEGPEMKYRFGRAMERKLGIKVFGPRGF
jgi:thiamine pyrophosphate-dependent acetolactate synthase large subunit-like protein